MILNWCWRRLLRVPWTARRSNQSILKEIIPEYSLEGLMLKLKLQYFGLLMGRTDSFEKILKLGKIEGGRRRERQRMWWLDDITFVAESEEELKSLDESERGEWEKWLKVQQSENEDHGIWSHHFIGNRWGNSVRLYTFGLQNHCRWWLQPWN